MHKLISILSHLSLFLVLSNGVWVYENANKLILANLTELGNKEQTKISGLFFLGFQNYSNLRFQIQYVDFKEKSNNCGVNVRNLNRELFNITTIKSNQAEFSGEHYRMKINNVSVNPIIDFNITERFLNISKINGHIESEQRNQNSYGIYTNYFEDYQLVHINVDVEKSNPTDSCPFILLIGANENSTLFDSSEFKKLKLFDNDTQLLEKKSWADIRELGYVAIGFTLMSGFLIGSMVISSIIKCIMNRCYPVDPQEKPKKEKKPKLKKEKSKKPKIENDEDKIRKTNRSQRKSKKSRKQPQHDSKRKSAKKSKKSRKYNADDE